MISVRRVEISFSISCVDKVPAKIELCAFVCGSSMVTKRLVVQHTFHLDGIIGMDW